MWKLVSRVAFTVFSFVLFTETAFGEGFSLYEYSARGIALGGAMVARKPDASAMGHNPALLTKLKGTHAMAGATAIMPRGNMRWKTDAKSGTTDLKNNTWVVPHVYLTQQLNDDWYLGFGEFSRFGLGFEYPHNWPGRFNIYQVSLESSSVNTNLAWAATDKLSLSAGLELTYVNLDLKKRAKIPVKGIANGSFEVDSNIQNADAFGPGFSLAGHYQFNDQWAAGLVYRSQVRVHAKGEAQFTYMGSTNVPAFLENTVQTGYKKNFRDGKAHSTVILPDSFAGGVSWTPVPEFSIEAGAIFTRWSSFRDLNIHMPHAMSVSESHKHWRDVWRFNVGVEYEPIDWLSLRAGYVFDQSPMKDVYEDYLIPTDGRHIYSAGVGVKWDKWTVDLGYAYIDANGRSYSGKGKEPNVLKSKATTSETSMVSMSLGYEF